MLQFLIRMSIAVCLSSMLFVINPASADDTAYFGQGETVIPINNSQIRMVSEVVRIQYDNKQDVNMEVNGGTFHVNCEFVFQNMGDATVVQMGFPDSSLSIRNFKTLIDGKAMAVTSKRVVPPIKTPPAQDARPPEEAAHVWSVSFSKGETKLIKNSYDVGVGVNTSMLLFEFTYVVRTGARWRDNIERAEFIIDLSDSPASPFFSITPPAVHVGGGVYRMVFNDFKPDFDIKIQGPILAGYKPGHMEFAWFLSRVDEIADYKMQDSEYVLNKNKLKQLLIHKKIDKKTAQLLRNLPFALHGRPFTTSWLRDYYSNQSWYKANPRYSDDQLSEFDRAFISTIKVYEDSLRANLGDKHEWHNK